LNGGTAVSADVAGRAIITDNVLSVDPRSRREVGLAEAYADDTVIRRNVATGVARGIGVSPRGDIGARIEDNILRGRTLGADDNTFDLLGIYLQNDQHHVARNLVTGFTQGGILTWATNVLVEDNDFRGNGGLDCSSPAYDDFSEVWQRNLGDESDPAGLCSPP
jgi:nitrous oxidase accessory protein NosD